MASVSGGGDADGGEPSSIARVDEVLDLPLGAAHVDAQRSLIEIEATVVSAAEGGLEEHHRLPSSRMELGETTVDLIRVDDRTMNRLPESFKESVQFPGSRVVHQSSSKRSCYTNRVDQATKATVAPRHCVV